MFSIVSSVRATPQSKAEHVAWIWAGMLAKAGGQDNSPMNCLKRGVVRGMDW